MALAHKCPDFHLRQRFSQRPNTHAGHIAGNYSARPMFTKAFPEPSVMPAKAGIQRAAQIWMRVATGGGGKVGPGAGPAGLLIIGALQRSAMEIEQTQAEPIEEYVPGVANGRNYMARLCHVAGGPWYIDVIHVESLAPLHGSDTSWPTREEAAQAADKLVTELAC